MPPQSTSPRPRRLGRSRWAAIGAAVAVTIGGGGLLRANAADDVSGGAAVFIGQTTPCRLLDTRSIPDTGGSRSGPLGPDETYTTAVTGTHGNCTIPTDVSSLVMNVTAADQSAASYLTLFAADIARPGTSNLNWSDGDGDVRERCHHQRVAVWTDVVLQLRGHHACRGGRRRLLHE